MYGINLENSLGSLISPIKVKKTPYHFISLVTEIYMNIPKALRPKSKENTEKQVATAGAAAQSMQ